MLYLFFFVCLFGSLVICLFVCLVIVANVVYLFVCLFIESSPHTIFMFVCLFFCLVVFAYISDVCLFDCLFVFTRFVIFPGGQAPLDPPLTHSNRTHDSPLTSLTDTHEHTNTSFSASFLNFFFYRPILLPLRQVSGIKQNTTYRRAGQLIKELRCPPHHSHALFAHNHTPRRFAHTFNFFLVFLSP